MNTLLLVFLLLFSCDQDSNTIITPPNNAYKITKTISYNDVSVDVVIDKPKENEVDVLIVYHGTVGYDNLILQAAHNTLNGFKRILDTINPAKMLVEHERSKKQYRNQRDQ